MSINIFTPPAATEVSLQSPIRIFLAGSIEMGKAVNWQDALMSLCQSSYPDENISFYNPRREDWDSSWEQKIENPSFYEQVNWELDNLEHATHIIFYFQPGTMSPISLLELGLHARNKKVYVVCPDGFWRKGNVDIVCERFDIKQFALVEDALVDIINTNSIIR